ncbi:MAG: cell division topological specificity factor MinE [Gammaproteobacteria bacterium]|nr:cell division topological specificity factor MinE [Gammaproteobacteria bacterium]
MTLLNYLLGRRKKTATVAKERLQIIFAREHADRNGPDYLPDLKKDILEVVAKYVTIDLDRIQVHLDKDGDMDILELNIILPDKQPEQHKVAVHS